MPDRLSILCVHGIGHGDVDAALIPAWRQVITAGLQRWKPGLEVDFDFLAYDEEFDHAPLHAATYAEALTRLAASGIVHGIGDLLPGTRGLSDMPALIRWTAGMIAQWATEDRLRERLRARVLDAVAGGRTSPRRAERNPTRSMRPSRSSRASSQPPDPPGVCLNLPLSQTSHFGGFFGYHEPASLAASRGW